VKGKDSSALTIHFGVSSRREGLKIYFPWHTDFGHEIWIRKERSQPSPRCSGTDKGGGIGQEHPV